MKPPATSPSDGKAAAPGNLEDSIDHKGALGGVLSETTAPTVLFVRPEYRNIVFSPALVEKIGSVAGVPANWVDPDFISEEHEVLSTAEVIFATWGTPKMDEKFLAAAPRLKAIFYAAGSPKSFLTPEVFDRGIIVCNAAAANAVPVADFTVSSILLSLKRVWQTMRETRLNRSWIKPETQIAGTFQSRVGIISLGLIGRRVARTLAMFDVEVLAYDPHLSEEDALSLGVKPASLQEIFETCDVVSLHTPLLPATEGLITGALMAQMKPNATLINTSRGPIIREGELCEVFKMRPDLTALLDVTDPEPPEQNSPLWELPNIFLTPHISGSLGPECVRMGHYMAEEFHRWRQNIPLQYQVFFQDLERMA
jgi:phosphoglycerate dehydrogenase-like enzyme